MTIAVRTPADVGALIRDRRRARELDQAELARSVGVSRLWINQVEKGKPGASLGLVLRTLDVLGIRLQTAPETGVDVATGEPVITADIDEIVANARRADRQ